MTTDTGIVAFLNARLDEDEAAAKGAASVAGPDWTHDTGWVVAPGVIIADTPSGPDDEETAPHIARHDPARVLREIAFHRAILSQYRTAAGWSSDNWPLSLRLFAAIWSDHPDYRQEWKP